MVYRILFCTALLVAPINRYTSRLPQIQPLKAVDSYQLYAELGLENEIRFEAFDMAVEGYGAIKDKRRNVLTLIDFSKPSTADRLYVIDMEARKLLCKSVVAHGKNSGGNYATSFSNSSGSSKSSLGFYLTDDTYIGKHGYSLRLDGLEKGINDLARQRAIVMHSADYADPGVIGSMGRLGRSLGCPALPATIAVEVINTIKNGSVLFIYADDRNYLASSNILSSYGKRAENMALLCSVR